MSAFIFYGAQHAKHGTRTTARCGATHRINTAQVEGIGDETAITMLGYQHIAVPSRSDTQHHEQTGVPESMNTTLRILRPIGNTNKLPTDRIAKK